jgi:hypothetical protein
MKKKVFVLSVLIVAVAAIVFIIKPPELKLKKGDRVLLSGIAGDSTEYYRIQLSGAQQIANYMSFGVTKIPKSDQRKVSAEELPMPITNDIARSFPGYRIRYATMAGKDNVTRSTVVVVKGFRIKKLVYEQVAFGSFIVKKR